MQCYACNRKLGKKPTIAVLIDDDGASVYVGQECAKKIKQAGASGYQPPLGGPRLFVDKEARLEFLGSQANSSQDIQL